MGDKLRARQAMLAAGMPIVPGGVVAITTVEEAERAASEFGLPIAVKASGGGGGKGLKVAHSIADLASALTNARREAEAYFGNGTLYLERYLDNAKHIELQILADKHGTGPARRRTRLFVAAPSPEAAGGDARVDRRRAAPAAARGRDPRRVVDRLRQRRHDRDAGRRRRILLPRNEHAHPGRAHDQRDDPRHRPRSRAVARRRRRTARLRTRRDRPARPRDRGARQRGGSGPRLPPGPRHADGLPRTGRSRRSRRLGGVARASSSRPTTIR